MPLKLPGFGDLLKDAERMAQKMDTDAGGALSAKQILEAAARPIEEQMKANASHDPAIRTGRLQGAISTGKPQKRRSTGMSVTIGVHRKDWGGEEYYPAFVEYGHGGPRPAPAHPYIRPAFDTRKEESFDIIRRKLKEELTNT